MENYNVITLKVFNLIHILDKFQHLFQILRIYPFVEIVYSILSKSNIDIKVFILDRMIEFMY